MRLSAAVACALTLTAATAEAASLTRLDQREHKQQHTIRRTTGTLRFFARHPRAARTVEGRRAARAAGIWLRVARRELGDTRRERAQHLAARARALQSAVATDWAARQIAAATVIGRESGGDPWPNCPDPWDGGSFTALVSCENGGSWYDSPGYYRCGLQFDPMWEQRFGRLCP